MTLVEKMANGATLYKIFVETANNGNGAWLVANWFIRDEANVNGVTYRQIDGVWQVGEPYYSQSQDFEETHPSEAYVIDFEEEERTSAVA